ncbi:MAG: hypothetical protein FWD25_08220 [Clostridia bacterium]|nr:hypothetical protein [Clostridia bacterium]
MSCKRKPRVVVLILALLVGFLCPVSASATVEGPGFASPRDALTAYIEGLQQGDLGQMMGAFAVETYVERYDLVARIEGMNSYMSRFPIRLPNASPLVKNLNIEWRRSYIANEILEQFFSFHWEDETIMYSSIGPFPHEIYGEIPDFVHLLHESMEPAALQSMELFAFIEPGLLDERYNEEHSQRMIERGRRAAGADELESVAAFFMVGSDVYLLTADAIRYGERWYLESLCGTIGFMMGMSPFGGGILSLTK